MSNADSFENFIQKMKVVIAVGCLKSKPQGVSGQEYAQQLCNKFQQGQLQWKEKYEQAETEIVHLKQQLALQQNNVRELMAVDDDGTGSDSLFPTPPSSGSHGNQTFPEAFHRDCVTDSLSKHTVFLHHVISLQTGSNLLSEKDTLTKRSIEHSLNIIEEHIGIISIPHKLQIQCIQSVLKLYQSCDCELKKKILNSVKNLTEKLISRIISREEYRTQTQIQHRELLLELSHSHEVCEHVLELLADSIKTFSDTLRQVSNREQTLDPYCFCSFYHIIDILDQSLQSVSGDTRVLSRDLRSKLLCQLEDSLLHLTEKFPLFAHAVWRLTVKLSS